MIRVDHAMYQYPHTVEPAIQDVSLSIDAQEIVGIVGPNGSGKSTLGRLLKGLLVPTGGSVQVDGLDTRRDTIGVRRLVGMVFQNPDNQIVNSTVGQEVAFGPENIGMEPSRIQSAVKEALDAVGLRGREDDECHGLTMAQKQRVALAAVMSMDPRYLILDEPTAWIEPRDRWPLLRTVVGWSRDRDVALILVTHRMDEAQLCDRLYGIKDGRVEASGRPDDLLGDPGVRARLALELPDTLVLLDDLRSAGAPVPPAVTDVDALADALWPS